MAEKEHDERENTGTRRRVLFISPQPFFQWRGSPIRVGFNMLALSQLGYEVDLLTLPFGEDRQTAGIRLIRVPKIVPVKNIPIGPSFWKAVYDLVLLCYAMVLAVRRRYSVIHGIEDAGLIAVIVGRLTGTKVIYEKHSDPASYKKASGIRNLLMAAYARVENFMAAHSDSVIGTGPGLVEQAQKVAGPVPVYHISDIPSSLETADPESTNKTRSELTGGQDRVILTYVGSFAVYQGIDLMFNAIPLVVGHCPESLFVVIGGSAEEIAERKRRLSEQGCQDNVVFVGRVSPDELPVYLTASDILLSPRISGINTPLKLLDYLKAGRAILATDVRANRLILDESCAALAAPEPDRFAGTAVELIKDEKRRQDLGVRGRKLTDETYNFDVFKKKLCDCYDRLPDLAPGR